MRNLTRYANIIKTKEKVMNLILNLIQNCFPFEKEPQKIGLCQIKENKINVQEKKVSVNNKNVKLSDLMRRAG